MHSTIQGWAIRAKIGLKHPIFGHFSNIAQRQHARKGQSLCVGFSILPSRYRYILSLFADYVLKPERTWPTTRMFGCALSGMRWTRSQVDTQQKRVF